MRRSDSENVISGASNLEERETTGSSLGQRMPHEGLLAQSHAGETWHIFLVQVPEDQRRQRVL